MKAAVFHEVGKPLAIEAIDMPQPEADDMLIKVKYCGICGTDLHATDNRDTASAPGTVLGHEFSGEVVDIGANLKGSWKEGDRLVSMPFIGCGKCKACLLGRPFECTTKQIIGFDISGAYAEYTRVHANECVKLPESVSLQEGALVEPLATGLHAVRRGPSPHGKNVLVIGAGPIGLATALWAHFMGARQVIVSELDQGRAELAAKFGATGLIDAKEPLAPQFEKLTGGQPEIIYECVGVPGMIQKCVEEAPYGAHLVVVGFCNQPDTMVPGLAMAKEVDMTFVIAYTKDDFQYVVDMIAGDRVDVMPMITHVVDFNALPQAFEDLRTPTNQCKVLLEPTL